MLHARSFELPSVVDTDPDATNQMAALLLEFVSSGIPAIGIRHNSGFNDTHNYVHDSHKQLTTDAFELIASEVTATNYFLGGNVFSAGRTIVEFVHDSPIHADAVLSRKDPVQEVKRLEMSVRLHTADTRNGAHVIAAHTAPAFFAPIGDADLFDNDDGEDSVKKYGYEFTESPDLQAGSWPLLEKMYDPTYSDGDIYLFEQMPLYSVVFCLHSRMGPSTIHKFTSMRTDIPRTAQFSGMVIASQLI